MLLSFRLIPWASNQRYLVLLTAGAFALIFILSALSRPSWPTTTLTKSPSSDVEHLSYEQPPLPSEQEETYSSEPPSPPPPPASPQDTPDVPQIPPAARPSAHPIDDLLKQADDAFQKLLSSEAKGGDVSTAAKVYRDRRQRHPPPGFDKWLEYAQSHNAVVIEDLFDQIYHDLEPFWSVEPATMRQQAIDWPFSISIRRGQARKRQKRLVSQEWLEYWELMFKDISQYLPDVDIALNQIDESRIIVPWEDITTHVHKAAESRTVDKPVAEQDVVTAYPNRDDLSFEPDDMAMTGLLGDSLWQSAQDFWELARKACPTDSPAARRVRDTDLAKPPKILEDFPAGSHHGFVSNWTLAKDPCQYEGLHNIHGNLVNPRWNSVNTTLFPLFSGCKLQGINNEILLPAAKYLSDEDDFASTDSHIPWEHKKGGVIWRGQATGGAHKANNWKRFHRQRFVAMLNGTSVSREEALKESPHQTEPVKDIHAAVPHQIQEIKGALVGLDEPASPESIFTDSASDQGPPHNIPRPDASQNPYNLSALQTSPTTLGRWIGPKADVGFDHLMCDLWEWSILGDGKDCGYLNPYYRAVERIDMSEQYKYKYLPDVDGNSYSGRYRAFLRSGSLPIKATIWSEWHDSRLIPWKHFVPIHSSYVDLWAVLEYFWGYGTGDGGVGSGHGMDFVKGGFREGENDHPELKKPGHDRVARRIAEEGRDWAQKVLRREDMLVYVYRLVLEYARVVSDEREKMMWVDDLL